LYLAPLHIGVNQLMLETPLDNEQRELADLIKVSADSLLSLINDILDLTRVESGKLELEYFDFDVRTTAGRLLRTSRDWREAPRDAPREALERRPSARSAVGGAEPTGEARRDAVLRAKRSSGARPREARWAARNREGSWGRALDLLGEAGAEGA